MTPLHFAALHGNEAACRVLLASGAKIDATYDRSFTPLHSVAMCSSDGAVGTVETLLKAHAQLEAMPGILGTPLHTAVLWRTTDVVRVLLRKGANPNCIRADGCTALANAVKLEELSIIRLLLNKDVDPNLGYHVTSFHDPTAVFYPLQGTRSIDIADTLIAYGARVDQQGYQGSTALLSALEKQNVSLAERFLVWGASPEIANDDGLNMAGMVSKVKSMGPRQEAAKLAVSSLVGRSLDHIAL